MANLTRSRGPVGGPDRARLWAALSAWDKAPGAQDRAVAAEEAFGAASEALGAPAGQIRERLATARRAGKSLAEAFEELWPAKAPQSPESRPPGGNSRSGPILCGGTPTEADRAVVAAFAAELGRRARSGGVNIGVLDAGGRLLVPGEPERAVPVATDVGGWFATAAELAIDQLWISRAAMAEAGLPAALERVVDDSGQAHRFMETEGWDVRPEGLAFWLHGWAREAAPGSEARQERDVVLTAYDHRGPWAGHDSADQLAGALGAFRDALGPFWRSPGTTAMRHMRSYHRGAGAVELGAPAEPPPAMEGQVEPDWRWARRLSPEEEAAAVVVGFDLNSAYLAQMGSVELGYGPATHLAAPAFDPRAVGYWRTDALRVDGLDPFPRSRGRLRWYTTETIALALQLGLEPRIREAWIFERHTRWLRSWQAAMRDARAGWIGSPEPAHALALSALKALYKFSTGWFASSFGETREGTDELWRPSWGDAIRAQTRANFYRRLAKVATAGAGEPFLVLTDAAYFATDDPDALAAALPVGPGLGQFKELGRLATERALTAYAQGPARLKAAVEARA